MAFLLYSLLFSITSNHPEPPFDLCDGPNLAENSPYRSSLDNLLSSMSSDLSPDSKFFETSNGSGSNKVYGLFLCYDYATQLDCRQCVEESSLPRDVNKHCPYKYEATVWVDYCLFRYSTRNFSGELNVTGNIPLDNARNVTDPQRFRSIVNRTLHDLVVVAAFNPSSGMHANGSEFFTEGYNLYAFVQCSKDLSPVTCNACLTAAVDDILVDRFYYTRGARVLSRSCFLRYELYNFVEGETEENLNLAPSSGKKNQKWIIGVLASGAGALALLALGCFVFRLVRRRRAKSEASDEVEMNREDLDDVADTSFGLQHGLDPQEFPFIEMEIIAEATDNFSELNKLGEGGFGPVFKGILSDGQFIAVKRLSINSEQGSEEFINEVLLIHKLQHVNLVKLLGFCVHREEKLLIYDYMPNGSLDSFLFDSRKRAQLNWRTRVDIINGVARGMLYLHQDSRLKIIHRDLKPSNILLDANMKPKISDFGMAKIFGGNDGEANTAKIVGTYGYMAPEFAMEGVYSIKSDVFSFGVLLLEMITGRRNARFHVTKLGPSLLAYAWKSWNEGKARELMDPILVADPSDDEEDEDEFVRCMQIGLLCVQEDARDRPSMASVVQMLNRDSTALSQPERPSFTAGNLLDHHSRTYLDNLSLNNLTISDLLPR